MAETTAPAPVAAAPLPNDADGTASAPTQASPDNTDAPEAVGGPLEVDGDDNSFRDDDSTYGEGSVASSVTSISSSVMKYREENGRTYHAYKVFSHVSAPLPAGLRQSTSLTSRILQRASLKMLGITTQPGW